VVSRDRKLDQLCQYASEHLFIPHIGWHASEGDPRLVVSLELILFVMPSVGL